MKLLLLGGSGLISGHLAREAVAAGREVWAVTRGLRQMDEGVRLLKADRYDADALRAALESAGTQWDAAFDCLCREPWHAQIALDVLPPFVKRYVVISTDSVYHPLHKQVPQTEESDWYMQGDSYGAKKREMELLLMSEEGRKLDWTILRPGHVFGPGSELGCFPEHMRQPGLLAHMRADKPLRLVGGGEYLLHPIYAKDLALTMLDCVDKPAAIHQIFCIGGPDVIKNREYYECIGRIIGHPPVFEEIEEDGYLESHADAYVNLCHRSYDLSKLRNAGVYVPCIPMEIGLRAHVDWLDSRDDNRRTIYLAGGCYWGVEKYLSNIPGVLETEVGFANGDTHNPTYKQVRYENTNHAETVRTVYDPAVLPLEKLLRLFWRIIDPVSVDQQGEDIGHQYRTGVYHTLAGDEKIIRAELEKLQKQYDQPLAVEACALEHFYSAEEYHQKYLDKNPGGFCHVPWAAINAVKDVKLEEI